MWQTLRHPNVVSFIGITQQPLQFVSEWMPNGNLTEYINKVPAANRISLVSLPQGADCCSADEIIFFSY